MKKQLHSHPRNFGKDSRGCRVTNSKQGLVRKYGINMSRRSFREQAELIGFHKYSWTLTSSMKKVFPILFQMWLSINELIWSICAHSKYYNAIIA